MTQDEVIRKISLEDDISNFEDFFDKEWMEKLSKIVADTRINNYVGNFAVSWWGNARAFVLPWLLVTGVSDAIKEFLPSQIVIPPQKAWNEYVKHPEFNIALWKLSENIYCSVYFAYENLIVNLLKEYLGEPIQATQRDFNKKLGDAYGEEFAHKIWHQTRVYAARQTRNSVVHNGGKATDNLLNVRPLPKYIQNDYVVISAAVVRNLYNELTPLVYELVEKSLEKIGS